MKTLLRIRIIIGAVIWASLAVFAATQYASGDSRVAKAASGIALHLAAPPARALVSFPEYACMQKGDPVCELLEGKLNTVGHVRSVTRISGVPVAVIEFYSLRRPPAADANFTAVPNPRTPSWVMEVLLPPDRRAEVVGDLRKFTVEHQDQILETFWKPSELFIRDALHIMQDDLPAVMEKRKPEIEKIIDRHKDKAFKEELLPVLKDEAWPIVRRRSGPLIETVGEELWNKLPMWELGWRAVYQKVPFVDDGIVKRRWARFVEEEAIPVMEGHTDEFLALVREIVTDLMSDPKVTTSLKQCLSMLVDDPDFGLLLRSVFLDLVRSESRLLAAFKERFSSPQFVDELNSLLEALGPSLTDAVDRILSADGGKTINPDLSQVLRTQILRKDACWILFVDGKGDSAGRDTVFRGGLWGWREGLDRIRSAK